MKILYIEDDINDAALVSMYAQAKQHDLQVAARTTDLQNVVFEDLDLVLIDIVLNHSREGYTIARLLREEGFSKPMLAVTALTTAADQAECREAGFDNILTKPYTITQLADMIGQYTP
jgi:DNA-binding response OmpR family regulator